MPSSIPARDIPTLHALFHSYTRHSYMPSSIPARDIPTLHALFHSYTRQSFEIRLEEAKRRRDQAERCKTKSLAFEAAACRAREAEATRRQYLHDHVLRERFEGSRFTPAVRRTSTHITL